MGTRVYISYMWQQEYKSKVVLLLSLFKKQHVEFTFPKTSLLDGKIAQQLFAQTPICNSSGWWAGLDLKVAQSPLSLVPAGQASIDAIQEKNTFDFGQSGVDGAPDSSLFERSAILIQQNLGQVHCSD